MERSKPISQVAEALENKIKSAVREVPDFPKPGIVFKDITPILAEPELCQQILELLTDRYSQNKPDIIVGIESRGFLFGMLLSQSLGIPFVPIRKEGKLPADTHRFSYDLEYGSSIVEIHKDAIPQESRVLVHDDLLATGGTAVAAAELIKMNNASLYGFNFLVELGFLSGRRRLDAYSENTLSLATYF